ncbi:arylsulfatase B-like [Pomacea canaliculata]|uniref:arylsulfatase B-like n=1 Tax=Pomacea canaliculata TaxID=400727 RepID=UPI000D72CD0D|nr:arylsulfatase B-like [Pomacea canaliculata]
MAGGRQRSLLCVAVLLFSIWSVHSEPQASSPPHIIFIIADDLGWADVNWEDPNLHSPNLYHLAQNGIILGNSYVQPLCSPSRSALMSGYFPFHTGLQHIVILPMQKAFLPGNLTTLPQALKNVGYSTHAIGKWHLGFCNWKYTPRFRGFDSFYGYYNADEDYYNHEHQEALDFRFNEEVDKNASGVYSTFAFSRRAQEILEEHNTSQPIFLYLAFQAVHYPLEVPAIYEESYCSHIKDANRRTYCGMLAAMDEAIGNITEVLERRGYTDNMLLVFTADNGGDPTEGASNWPLRGAKSTLWEGGTRGKGLLYSKNLFKKTGTTYNGLMHIVDWFPTFMTLAGGETPSGIDGVSQWDAIVNDKASPRTEFVYNIDEINQNAAIRVGDWKLIQGSPGNQSGWYPPPQLANVVTEKEDFVAWPHSYSLFNINEDPLETTDVASKYPDVLAALKTRLGGMEGNPGSGQLSSQYPSLFDLSL